MKTTGCRLLALGFAMTACLHAGPFEETLAKANGGDLVSQLEAANAYANGLGVDKNPKEAAVWYEKAADQGNADAQLALGNLLISGKGVPRDSKRAASYFLLAAEQGKTAAQVQMARMLLSGAGVAKNERNAYMWARIASEQGDKSAKPILSKLSTQMPKQEIAMAEADAKEYLAKKTSDDAGKGVPPVAPPLE
jgi:hypothetical protein